MVGSSRHLWSSWTPRWWEATAGQRCAKGGGFLLGLWGGQVGCFLFFWGGKKWSLKVAKWHGYNTRIYLHSIIYIVHIWYQIMDSTNWSTQTCGCDMLAWFYKKGFAGQSKSLVPKLPAESWATLARFRRNQATRESLRQTHYLVLMRI